MISVSDKTGLIELAQELVSKQYSLIGSDGTTAYLQNAGIQIQKVSDLTKSPEILGGRVKTLHPAIFGGKL